MSYPGLLLLTTLALLSAGCSDPTEVSFSSPRKVSREQRPTTWDAPTRERLGMREMDAAAAPDAGQQEPQQEQWIGTTPSGWEQLPPQPKMFRELLWRVAGNAEAECYLSPGVGGGVRNNMNRWYTLQFGITEVPNPEALPVVDLAGRQARLVELAGTYNKKPGTAMLLAFYAEGEQVTSLKLTGPEAVVKQNREQFLALAKSLRMQAAGPEPARGAGASEKTPATSPHGTQDPGRADSGFTATVPAGWTVKTPSNRMLHYTFGSEGEVYMSQLGGTLRPTLDIWRGELGLPPISDSELEALRKVPMLGGEATLLDATGDFRSMSGRQIPGARVLVAAQVEGSAIIFVKLVGKAAEVEAQRDGMLQFLASLRRTP